MIARYQAPAFINVADFKSYSQLPRKHRFDIVIADTMSHMRRDEEDRAAIRKRLTFVGISTILSVELSLG